MLGDLGAVVFRERPDDLKYGVVAVGAGWVPRLAGRKGLREPLNVHKPVLLTLRVKERYIVVGGLERLCKGTRYLGDAPAKIAIKKSYSNANLHCGL